MDTMIELPAMRRTAELAPNTADATARTVEVVWSAGARVRRASFFGEPYDEELSLDPTHVRLERLNAGAPFLKVHELGALDAVIGSVVPGSARLENGRGIALVRISERDDVEPIWRDILAGHIRAVSIGYQVHRFEVSKPDGGRELWRAVDWTPFEVSAVPVGADPAAGFRAQQSLHDCVLHRRDASTPRQGASPMTDPTQTPAAVAAEPHATEETQMTTPTNPAAEPQARAVETRALPQAAPVTPPDTEAIATRAREGERDRVSTIYDLAGRLNLERGFAEDLVKRGVTVEESRRLILDQVAAKSDETRTFPHVSIPLGGRDERVTLLGGANALAVETGPGKWEVVQASAAELIAPGRYRLTRLLRGQRGTEAAMGNPTPAGARVVVLDSALAPLPIAEADLGLPWNWRIGPAARAVSDASYTAQAFTPAGRGLVPFAPVHVAQPWRTARSPGDLTIRWTRRSRALVADAWEQVEVPLAEDAESYDVQILDGAVVSRSCRWGPASAPSAR